MDLANQIHESASYHPLLAPEIQMHPKIVQLVGLQRIYPLEEPWQFPRVKLSLYQPAVVAFAAEAFVGGSFAYYFVYFHPAAEAYCPA